MLPSKTCSNAARPLSRRDWLLQTGAGFGGLALSALLADTLNAAANPLAPKAPHFEPRVKRVIMLFMFGGLWLLVPFVLREQPRFVRRALLTFPVFLLPMLVVGTIDEARLYAEWVPLVATACLLALATQLGFEVRRD